MLTINGKTFMNLQEAVAWLLANNALPFQCKVNFVADTEIPKTEIINPAPAELKIGSLVLFADGFVGTVNAVTTNGFKVGSEATDLSAGVPHIADIALDASGHLIIMMSEGDPIDAGLVKQISGFTVDASQHLIAHYNDGTTQDLGAIFAGNITISGDLTVTGKTDTDVLTSSESEITAEKPIIEVMSAYSLRDQSPSITNAYIGVVKNGNKLTFAISFEVNLAVQPAYDILPLASFYIPNSVASKLYANTWNYLSNVVNANAIVAIATPQSDGVETNYYVQKNSDGGGYFVQFNLVTTNLALNTNYKIRIEQTYLLSQNLAS